ncbi:MAG: polysaccharide deacetylase family protein [Woeseiaceae bacterium]
MKQAINPNQCTWPGDSRSAVAVTFDFDAESLWFSEKAINARKPSVLSQGTYGPKVGLAKILNVLKEFDVPATFFVPGWTAENHPVAVQSIAEAGHEIGHHGHLHKFIDPDKPDEEIEEMEKGLAALDKVVGIKPAGYRAPAADSSDITIKLVHEYGFLYDSSFSDDDFPYRHSLENGKPGPIELPFHWHLDDSAISLFMMDYMPPIVPSTHILELWKEEFTAMHEEGGLVMITLHPQIIGRPNRLKMLREFLAFMRAHGDAWFSNCTDIANAWQASTGESR